MEGEVSLSINQRELLAVERGLRALCFCLEGQVVAVFSDNTTTVVYLRRQGGTLSPALNVVAQCILRWAEQLNIILMPQFVHMGSRAYSFSVFGLDVNLDYVFLLVLLILCNLNIENIICAPHSYVQVYAVAAFEDHCLVLSFGGLTV